MPDPPTTAPANATQPSPKKQKLDTDAADEEWETIEKPHTSAGNGSAEDEIDAKTAAKIEEQVRAGEAMEEQNLALNVAANGGGIPIQTFGKDW